MKASMKTAAVILGGMTWGALSGIAWGDCGSVPFTAPLKKPIEVVAGNGTKRDIVLSDGKEGAGTAAAQSASPEIRVDPLKVSVFEPKQRAIILWNGEEEILLLSTDQRASQKSSVLEVIPLPGEPKVRLGSFKTFEAAQKLVVEKRMWACAHGGAKADAAAVPAQAGRITFAEKMGAHDLAVAEVANPDGFVQFVQNYLHERYQVSDAPIRPEFVKVIESYLNEGYRWFAFDVIEMDGSVQSREPIEYRFKSDRVHYPLRISSLEKGKTEAELLVFTADGAKRFEGIPASEMDIEPALGVSPNEVYKVDDKWSGFFGNKTSLIMDQWSVEGESAKLTRDVKVK